MTMTLGDLLAASGGTWVSFPGMTADPTFSFVFPTEEARTAFSSRMLGTEVEMPDQQTITLNSSREARLPDGWHLQLYSNGQYGPAVGADVSEQVLQYVERTPRASLSDIAEALGKTTVEISPYISQLRRASKLHRVADGATWRYTLLSSGAKETSSVSVEDRILQYLSASSDANYLEIAKALRIGENESSIATSKLFRIGKVERYSGGPSGLFKYKLAGNMGRRGLEDRILQYLSTQGDANYHEVADAMSVSRIRSSEVLGKMVRDGDLEEVTDPGRYVRYRIPGKDYEKTARQAILNLLSSFSSWNAASFSELKVAVKAALPEGYGLPATMTSAAIAALKKEGKIAGDVSAGYFLT